MSEDKSCSTTTEAKLEANPNFLTSNFADVVIFRYLDYKLITAPHHFGKSTNLDMIKKFVEIEVDENGGAIVDREESSNYKLFREHNLLIYQDWDFFNGYFDTYLVIRADFKLVLGNDFDEVLNKFQFVLHNTFKQYPYLLESKKLNIGETECFKTYYEEKNYKNLDITD